MNARFLIRVGLLVTAGCVLLGRCSAPLPAEPPSMPLTREQREKLKERDRLSAEVKKFQALAEMHENHENFPAARKARQEVLEIKIKLYGEKDWRTTDARLELDYSNLLARLQPEERKRLAETDRWMGRVIQLNAKGQYAAAIPLAKKAVEARTTILGTKHLRTGWAKGSLASLYWDMGDYTKAEQFCRQALDIRKQVLGEKHPSYLQSLNNLALLYDSMGEYAKAEPLYRQVLEICKQVLGEKHSNYAACLHNLSVLYWRMGEYAKAEPLCRQSLEITKEALGEKHPEYAKRLAALALLYGSMGKYAKAEPLHRQALYIDREVLGEKHPYYAQSLHNLATLYGSMGEYAKAETLHRQALDIRKQVLGEKHPDYDQSLNNLATLYMHMGDYAKAEPLLRQALEIKKQVQGEKHPDYAIILSNLANLYFNMGDYAKAKPLYRQALEIQKQVLGEKHPAYAYSLYNLALLYHYMGDYAKAEPLYRQALEITKQVQGETHPHNVQILGDLSGLYWAMGAYAKAEEMALAAAKSFEVARLKVSFTGLGRAEFGAKHSPMARLAADLARNGKAAEAWNWLEKDLGRGLFDDMAARTTRPLTTQERRQEEKLLGQLTQIDKRLPQLLAAQQKFPQKAEEFRQNVEKLQQEGDRLMLQLAQFQADMETKYGPAAGQVYDRKKIQGSLSADTALLAWLDLKVTSAKVKDPNGEHWAALLFRDGPPVLLKLAGSGAGGAWTKDDDALPGKVRAALLAKGLVSRGLDFAHDPRPKDYPGDRLAKLRMAPIEDYLLHHRPAVKHLVILPSPSLAGIPLEILTSRYHISYAPSGTMFAYLSGGRKVGPASRRSETAETAVPPSLSLLALGDPDLSREKPAPPPPLPDRGVAITRVLPKSNAARAGIHYGDVLLSYAGDVLNKSEDLLTAIRKHAAGGEAAEIPLRIWRQGKRLEVHVRPGRLGVAFSTEPAREAILAQRAADDALRTSLRGEYFRPLPGTRLEVEALARLFAAHGGRVEKLLAAEASEQRLEQLEQKIGLRQFRYLHLATHAKADVRGGMLSFLVLSPPPLEPGRSAAFAPAYGRLTAADILRRWNLGADVVTLSACQTGLGKMSGGEGYVGFAQALLLAGAQSVVLSQWSVDDTATTLLMERFYQNLLAGRAKGVGRAGDASPRRMSKAAALAEAKAWLRGLTRKEAEAKLKALIAYLPKGAVLSGRLEIPAAEHPYAHPNYWAAFILSGDWR